MIFFNDKRRSVPRGKNPLYIIKERDYKYFTRTGGLLYCGEAWGDWEAKLSIFLKSLCILNSVIWPMIRPLPETIISQKLTKCEAAF